MKTLAVLCNVLLIIFTCFVLATDGGPKQPAYVLLSVLMFGVPAFTVFTLARRPKREAEAGAPVAAGSAGTQVQKGPTARPTAIERAAGLCNIFLLGFICWALYDQYPHPAEAGFIPYVALTLLAPVLSIVTLFFVAPRSR